jgi:lysophospholipase L1-like esterase
MIDIVARFALFPLLYAQAQGVRAGVVPLPEPKGRRAGRVGAGSGELRLLVIGDSSAVGVGAGHQDEALALPLARRLAQRLGTAVRWRLIGRTGLTSEATLQCLQDAGVPEADLAVVVLGVNDITQQVPMAQALKHRADVAIWLNAHAGVADVVFPALPEMQRFPSLPQPLAWWVGQMSGRNNRAQARWAESWPLAAPRVHHVPMDGLMQPDLMGIDGFHPGPRLYARVAEHLAARIDEDVLGTERLSEEKQ